MQGLKYAWVHSIRSFLQTSMVGTVDMRGIPSNPCPFLMRYYREREYFEGYTILHSSLGGTPKMEDAFRSFEVHGLKLKGSCFPG